MIGEMNGILPGWTLGGTLDQNGPVWEIRRQDGFGHLRKGLLRVIALTPGQGETVEALAQRTSALAEKLHRISALGGESRVLGYAGWDFLPQDGGWQLWLHTARLETLPELCRRKFSRWEVLRLSPDPTLAAEQVGRFLAALSLPPKQIIALGVDICRALECLHRAGCLVNRVSPSCICRHPSGLFFLSWPGIWQAIPAGGQDAGELEQRVQPDEFGLDCNLLDLHKTPCFLSRS